MKDGAYVIAEGLTNLFNRSVDSSIFPLSWKFGKITALFKSGNCSDPHNYRPITVLPTVSKILERAVHCQLYNYLTVNKILTSKQFGFRPKLSTSIALAHFTDNILEKMDNGYLTGALFLWPAHYHIESSGVAMFICLPSVARREITKARPTAENITIFCFGYSKETRHTTE